MSPFLRRLTVAALLPLALVLGVAGWLHAPPGEDFAARKLEQLTGARARGLRLDWPFRLHADRLDVADSRGPWLAVEDLNLAWKPLRLLRGVLHIQRLTAARVQVLRPPEAEGGRPAAPPSLPPVELRLFRVAAPITLEKPVLGERVDLTLDGMVQARPGGGQVDLQLAADDGAQARLSGMAGTDYVDLRWSVAVPQLGRWQRLAGVSLAGRVAGAGFVAGRLPHPAISGRLEAGPGKAAGLSWTSLRLEGLAAPQGDGLQTALTAEIQALAWNGDKPPVPLLHLAAAGHLDPNRGDVRLGSLRAEGGGMVVSASGLVRGWGRDVALRLRGGIQEVGALIPGARGGASVQAMVRGDALQPRLDARLRLFPRDLRTGLAAVDRMLGPSPRLAGDVRLGPDGRARFLWLRAEGERAVLTGQGLAGTAGMDGWARLDLPALSVLSPRLQGSGTAWARIRGAGMFGLARLEGLRTGRAAPLAGAAAFDLREVTRAPSGTVTAVMNMGTLPLTGFAAMRYGGGALSLRGLDLRSGDARLSGDVEVTAAGLLRGHLDGSIPQLRDWAELDFLPVSGPLTARAVFEAGEGQIVRLLAQAGEWRAEAAAAVFMGQGQGELRLERLRLARTGSAVALAEPAAIRWSARRIELSAARLVLSNGGEVGRGTVQGAATLPAGALSGRAECTADAARLMGFLPATGQVVEGRLEARAQLAGTLSRPLVQGRATLSRGRLEDLDSGAMVTAVEAEALFQGDSLRLTLAGGDGGRGSLRGEGRAARDGSWRGRLSLTDFAVLRRDDVQATARGQVELAGQGASGQVSGELDVIEAEVDLGRLKGGGPAVLEVVEINRPGQVRQSAAKPRPRPAAAAPSSITVAAEIGLNRVFVRGRGLDSEWQGRVLAAGPVSAPLLTGQVQPVRGEYELLGRQFRLSPDSALRFEGGQAEDAALDVTASARAEEVTAQVKVTGTPRQPQVAITSDPALPQDEVLARLLFGREAGKLSAFQQLQLAQMATSGLWSQDGGGFDPLGKLRGALGLDVLGVGGGEPGQGGGPTLSAGKYVGRDTFVRVEQGAQGLGKVTVEQELGRGFSVETGVGQQGGSGVGFNWRKDY